MLYKTISQPSRGYQGSIQWELALLSSSNLRPQTKFTSNSSEIEGFNLLHFNLGVYITFSLGNLAKITYKALQLDKTSTHNVFSLYLHIKTKILPKVYLVTMEMPCSVVNYLPHITLSLVNAIIFTLLL